MQWHPIFVKVNSCDLREMRVECAMQQFVRNCRVLSRVKHVTYCYSIMLGHVRSAYIPKRALIVQLQTMSTDRNANA